MRSPIEYKFNPYHDPRNGQFTFAPGGGRSVAGIIVSEQRVGRSIIGAAAVQHRPLDPVDVAEWIRRGAIRRTAEVSVAAKIPQLQQIAYRLPTSRRSGGNGGPPLNDPMTLIKLFPGLGTSGQNGASGVPNAIVSIADNILDLTGPASRLTAELTSDHVNQLLSQIRNIEPAYRFESLGFPQTVAARLI